MPLFLNICSQSNRALVMKWSSILQKSFRNDNFKENVTLKYVFAQVRMFRALSILLASYNERFPVVFSSCCQNRKCGYFTLLFGRGRQGIFLQCVPNDYFLGSFGLSNSLFLAVAVVDIKATINCLIICQPSPYILCILGTTIDNTVIEIWVFAKRKRL